MAQIGNVHCRRRKKTIERVSCYVLKTLGSFCYYVTLLQPITCSPRPNSLHIYYLKLSFAVLSERGRCISQPKYNVKTTSTELLFEKTSASYKTNYFLFTSCLQSFTKSLSTQRLEVKSKIIWWNKSSDRNNEDYLNLNDAVIKIKNNKMDYNGAINNEYQWRINLYKYNWKYIIVIIMTVIYRVIDK